MPGKRHPAQWPWYGLLALLLLGMVIALWAATQRVHYSWHWDRVPQYFLYQDEVLQSTPVAGTVAQIAADGHEALLVSHQLPIWVTRLRAEGRPFFHDPRKRECSLASVTSLRFDGDRFVGLDYSEPVADLLPGASKVAGA